MWAGQKCFTSRTSRETYCISPLREGEGGRREGGGREGGRQGGREGGGRERYKSRGEITAGGRQIMMRKEASC